MNRRGHLSHKIPNVKLRPAPAPSSATRRGRSARNDSPEVWREALMGGDDEDDEMDGIASGSGRPWQGIHITFTGVEEKNALTEMVRELGGETHAALTVHVTHVVANSYGSPKYNYALEHHLPVMTPEWIERTYDLWKHDKPLDMAELQEALRLKPFAGLKIVVSGIDNLERRRQIVDWVGICGGVYSKDLDRTCTHLISAKITSDSKSSEKVRWALKEIQTRDIQRRRGKKFTDEDIRIVYEEWIWDCAAYKGRWKEDLYDARKPRPEAKVKAEAVLSGSFFSEVEAAAEEKKAEIDQPAVIKKRKREAMDSLVGDIISTAARDVKPKLADLDADTSGTRMERVPTEDDVDGRPPMPAPDVARMERRHEPEKKASLLHVSRETSFTAHVLPPQALSTPSASTIRPSSSFPPTGPMGPTQFPSTALPTIKAERTDITASTQFFEGLRFGHLITQECRPLLRALEAHGGIFVLEDEWKAGAEVDYIIVRLNSMAKPESLENEIQPEVVTECWVEACCFEQRMIPPDDHIVFRPLPAQMPIPGAERLNVHLSSWSSGEQVYLKRMLRAIGGQLSETMNRKTTHLVTSVIGTKKANKAPEWGVKIVRDSWLFTMGRTGRLEPESEHIVTKVVEGDQAPINPVISHTRKLENRIDSTANMSIVSQIGDPTFEKAKSPLLLPPRNITPPPGATHSISEKLSQTISPSRMLKMTPTHIDEDLRHGPRSASGSLIGVKATSQGGKSGPLGILSPPKAETERLLNRATLPPRESTDSKISRTTSAPPTESLRGKGESVTNPLKASSTSAAAYLADRSTEKDRVTEALKRIAEGGDTPSSKGRVPRRPRANRPKPAHARTSLSPSKRNSSPFFVAGAEPELDPEAMREALKVHEETMTLKQIDPLAEREKKRMLDAMRREERKLEREEEEAAHKKLNAG